MKAEKPDDVLLWQRFRSGDSVSFDQLVQAYYQTLFRYGIRFENDEEYIKDCIQDVFVELWQRRQTVRETEFVKFYLLKSLRRRIFRGKAKWGTHWESVQENYLFEVEFSIESQMIVQEVALDQVRQLEILMNQLSKRQKEVIFLKFYQGLTHEQIAEVMVLNRQSVYNILHEALQKLRNAWQGDMAFSMALFTLLVQ